MSKKNSKRWFIGGGVIAAAIVGISFLNLGDNLIYFYTPSEAFAKAAELDGQTIKVGGMVKGGSVEWKPEDLSLSFVLTDLDSREIKVQHKGTPPDMFKENSGVVVEGRLADAGNGMVSRNLLVKHSEEYKKPGDHSKMDKMLLEQSLFKGQKMPDAKKAPETAPKEANAYPDAPKSIDVQMQPTAPVEAATTAPEAPKTPEPQTTP